MASEGIAIMDDFKMLDYIGPDPNGTLIRAMNKENGSTVAIKSISSFFIEKKETSRGVVCFLREYRNLNHPAVSPLQYLIGPDIDNPTVYRLVSEYHEKGSLIDLYKCYPFPQFSSFWTPTRKSIIAFGIASAMQYLHGNVSKFGFLLPCYVLFDKYFYPHLTQFWQSVFIPQSKHCDATFEDCSPYEAPEATSLLKHSKPVDVYTYGVILYELAFEDPVYNKENFSINDVLSKEPIHSKRLYSLILSCLSADQSKRPSFDFIVSSFYDDIDQLFPNTDMAIFSEYRRNLMKDYIKENSQIQLFEYGNNPTNLQDHDSMYNYAKSCGYLKPFFLFGQMIQKVEIIKLIAVRGNKSAQYAYSTLIEQTDPESSRQFLELSAQQGYLKAIVKLATIEKEDPQYLKLAADSGSSEMQVKYALHSHKLYYLKMAAKQKNSQALYLLGLFEETGPDVRFLDQIAYQKAFEEQNQPHDPVTMSQLSESELIAENVKLNASYNKAQPNMAIDDDNYFDNEDDDYSFHRSFFNSQQKAFDVISSLSDSVIYKNLYSAISHYNGAALLNNSEAVARLEMINKEGEKLFPKIEQIFQQNDSKKSDLLIMYAMMVLQGCFNVGKDIQKAAKILDLAARYTRNPDAMYQLSKLLLERFRTTNNNEGIVDQFFQNDESKKTKGEASKQQKCTLDAILYLRTAANAGHAKACIDYGNLLFNRRHASKSTFKESLKYFRQAANIGCTKAMMKYAKIIQNYHQLIDNSTSLNDNDHSELYQLFFNDKTLEFGNPESIVYCRIAASRGLTDAQYRYAKILDRSISIENETGKNDEAKQIELASQCLFYYKLASKQGLDGAMLGLAELYEREKDRYLKHLKLTDRDVTKKYLVAGSKGNAHALRMVAQRFAQGLGVASDTELALHYYRLAAILGDYTSQFRYGHYYTFQHKLTKALDINNQLESFYFLIYSLFQAFNMNNCLSVYNEIEKMASSGKDDSNQKKELINEKKFDFFNHLYSHLSSELISRFFDPYQETIRQNELKQSFTICRQALRSIAFYYYDSFIHKTPDYDAALYYLSESKYFGNDEDINVIGDIFKKKKRFQDAFNLFMEGSKRNDLKCIFHLAQCYVKGIGTPINYLMAGESMAKLIPYNLTFALPAAQFYDRAYHFDKYDIIKNERIQFSKATLETAFLKPFNFIDDYYDNQFSEEETENLINLFTIYYKSLRADDNKLYAHGRLAYFILNQPRFFHYTNTQEKSDEYNSFLKNFANEKIAVQLLQQSIIAGNEESMITFLLYLQQKLQDPNLPKSGLLIFNETDDLLLTKLKIMQMIRRLVRKLAKRGHFACNILTAAIRISFYQDDYILRKSVVEIRQGIKLLRDILKANNTIEQTNSNLFNKCYQNPNLAQRFVDTHELISPTPNEIHASCGDAYLLLSFLFEKGILVEKNPKVASYFLYSAKSYDNLVAPHFIEMNKEIPAEKVDKNPRDIELEELYTSLLMDVLPLREKQVYLFRLKQMAFNDNNWKAQYYLFCLIDQHIDVGGSTYIDILRLSAANIVQNNIKRDPNSSLDPASVLIVLVKILMEVKMIDTALYYLNKAIEIGSEEAVKLKLKIIALEISRTGRNLQPEYGHVPTYNAVNQFYITLRNRLITPPHKKCTKAFFLEERPFLNDDDIDFQIFQRKQILIGRDIQLANLGNKVIERLLKCYLKRKDDLDPISQCNLGILLNYATDQNSLGNEYIEKAAQSESHISGYESFLMMSEMLYNDNIQDYTIFLPDKIKICEPFEANGFIRYAYAMANHQRYLIYDNKYRQCCKERENQNKDSSSDDIPVCSNSSQIKEDLDKRQSEIGQNYQNDQLGAKLKRLRKNCLKMRDCDLKDALLRGNIEAVRLLSSFSSESDWKNSSNYNKIGASLGDKLSMFRRARDLIHGAVLIGYRVKNKKRTKAGFVTKIHSPSSKKVDLQEEEEILEKEPKVVEITNEKEEHSEVNDQQVMYGRLLMREARTYLECYARTSGRGSFLLGTLYECGKLLKKNYMKAYLYYAAASALGYTDALLRMAALLAFGGFDLDKDEMRSLIYAKKAAFFRIPEAVKAESEGLLDKFDKAYTNFLAGILSASQTIDGSNLKPKDDSSNENIQLPTFDINLDDPIQTFNEKFETGNLLHGLSINAGEYGMTQLYYQCFGENGIAYGVPKHSCDFDCDYDYEYDYEYEYEEEEEEADC